jgi:hypothetical protein
MSAALNFNQPAPAPVTLWREVAIGWEHDIVDGEVVYREDGDGNPVPKVYRIPGAVTGKDLIDRAQQLPKERLEALQKGDTPALFEISAMLVGDDVITQIGSDPTVPPATFYAFLGSLVEGLDATEFTGAQDPKA